MFVRQRLGVASIVAATATVVAALCQMANCSPATVKPAVGDPVANIKIVSYNVMSLRQAGRSADVYELMKGHTAVLLQGTRQPQSLCQQECKVVHEKHYSRFQFPYSRRCNSHAGVEIGVDRRVLPTVTGIAWPEDLHIQGRCGAIRCKTKGKDLVLISAYVPPNGTAVKTTADVYHWISKFISALPSRCVPIVGIDANGRTGLDNTGAQIQSPAIGGVHRETENENGRMMRLFLEDNSMLAANSVIGNMAETFWSASRNSTTRIDYICVPQGLHTLGRIRGGRVLRRLGDRLQLIRTSFRADHRPGVWPVESVCATPTGQ
eukprot:TRINITY_DN71728_c0_g1_i1.p1 TRINITY_DN71728_c0_g1~~TRINITY_DN71728_c0_g1_i1.p1  ORF type:complete len:321 (+),score=14.53 TRINITY_DN71728_c0_g1_i1:62-1024(+)